MKCLYFCFHLVYFLCNLLTAEDVWDCNVEHYYWTIIQLHIYHSRMCLEMLERKWFSKETFLFFKQCSKQVDCHFFARTGEWLQNRVRPLQCNPVPCCSPLSGDGQGPGWTYERMWKVRSATHDLHAAQMALSAMSDFKKSMWVFIQPFKVYLWLCVHCSSAMLEESQDGMDSGTLSPASARQVTIQRHPTQGFGFIAGSQRPVIVRSVSAG